MPQLYPLAWFKMYCLFVLFMLGIVFIFNYFYFLHFTEINWTRKGFSFIGWSW